jgi:hypothetical protein
MFVNTFARYEKFIVDIEILRELRHEFSPPGSTRTASRSARMGARAPPAPRKWLAHRTKCHGPRTRSIRSMCSGASQSTIDPC